MLDYEREAEVYPGRITLFRPTELDQELVKNAAPELVRIVGNPAYGWDRLSPHPIDIHIIPGYHETMVFEPYVGVLAERLRTCINTSRAH
jgi:hypothetical protein